MNTKHAVMFTIAGLIAVMVFIMPFMPIRDMNEHPAFVDMKKPAVEPTADIEPRATDGPIEMSPATREAIERGRAKMGPVTPERRQEIEWRLEDISTKRQKTVEGLAIVEKLVLEQEARIEEPPETFNWQENPYALEYYSELWFFNPEAAEEYALESDAEDEEMTVLFQDIDTHLDHMVYDGRDQLQRKLEELAAEEAALRAELGE